MALVSSMMSPYTSQPQEYSRCAQPPRPPPSPPVDEYKCSLPSISNLLGLADAGSPSSEASMSRRSSPRLEVAPRYSGKDFSHIKTESRPGSSQLRGLPLTPPSTTTDASFDGYHSPSRRSFSSAPVSAGRYYETTPPLEPDVQRHHQQVAGAPRIATKPSAQHPLHVSTPSQSSTGAYYPTPTQTLPPPQAPGLQYQRPLPQSFPPQAVQVSVAPPSGGYVWQHHHYLNPSHGASFPPSQDRYICQTCNKAFSRPSSLRIHSHSHTGEKPFKCPHTGCGKAFSVRSNMKRHERGCHGFDVGKGPIMIS